MKKIKYPAIIAAFFSLTAFALITTNWRVKEDGSIVEFSGGKINGSFKGLKANIAFDKEHPEQARITASVEAPSVATGFFLKNSHAKDALGADQYPTIKFASTAVNKSGNDYVAKGNLTMKGVTRPASIYFTFDDKGSQGIFKGTLKITPKNFGIDRSGTPDEVTVKLTVPVTKS